MKVLGPPILVDQPESRAARLLRSARLDEPSSEGKRRVLAAVGVASGAATAGAGALLSSTPPATGAAVVKVATLTKVALAVTLAVGATVGVAQTVRVHASSQRSRRAQVPAAQTTEKHALQSPSSRPVAAVSAGSEPVDPAVPAVVAPASRPAPAAPPSVLRASPESDPEPMASPPLDAGAAGPPTSEDEHASLTREISALRSARQSLAAADARAALRELDEYERQFERSQLEPEATALRVEALVGLGRIDDARAAANRLLASEEGQAYSKRVRALLERASGPDH